MHLRHANRRMHLRALLSAQTLAKVAALVVIGLAVSAVAYSQHRLTDQEGTGRPVSAQTGVAGPFVFSIDRTESAPRAEAVPTNTQAPSPTPALPVPTRASVQAQAVATAPPTSAPVTEGEAQMRAWLAQAGWTAELIPKALAVSWCESHWIPTNSNGLYVGLFQISQHSNATIKGSWFAYFGFEDAQWADPVVNASVAYLIWLYGGWAQWPVCGL